MMLNLPGCRHLCRRSLSLPQCCNGYWGTDCQECPGGADSPCFGNGKCHDTIDGNGTCACEENFTGYACERCKNKNMYGPDCDEECRCVHGTCSGGPFADGSCDCDDGWEGQYCDDEISACATVTCHENAKCQDVAGHVTCTCERGYHGNGTHCEEWDPCLLPVDNLCAEQAVCTKVPSSSSSSSSSSASSSSSSSFSSSSRDNIPSSETYSGSLDNPSSSPSSTAAPYTCTCIVGYHGDGYNCQPIDPCQTNYGDCDIATTECIYHGPDEHECRCLEGFDSYENGRGCSMTDQCAVNDTLCPANSNCSMIGPNMPVCQCIRGFISSADGEKCLGNILLRVKDLHNFDPEVRGTLSYMIRLMEQTYMDTFIHHGPFTFFAVTDTGFSKSLGGRGISALFADMEGARQTLRQHLLPVQLAVEQLNNATSFYNLEGGTAQLVNRRDAFYYRLGNRAGKKARLVKSDVIASNGVIHVLDRLVALPPVVVGDVESTVYRVIKSDVFYGIFFDLIKVSGLDVKLDNPDNRYTVFAPPDGAFKTLPEGALDYLKSLEGLGKLKTLVKNHIVSGPDITSANLINLQSFSSMAGVSNKVQLGETGSILLNGDVRVSQTDIPGLNGYVHHIEALLLPSFILPILPHRCDATDVRTVKGICGACHKELRCVLPGDKSLNSSQIGCSYTVNVPRTPGTSPIQYRFHGCYTQCDRTFTTPKCCPGFYGSECYPCPGGFQTPCYGRGKCVDGYFANGTCVCDAPYKGDGCELCVDPNKYGGNCSKECTCLHGTCDNRVEKSLGRCEEGSCKPGYIGENCEYQAKRCGRGFRCHAHASCVEETRDKFSFFTDFHLLSMDRLTKKFMRKLQKKTATCVCNSGYEGSGAVCTEINPCNNNYGDCDLQANCTHTGPGQHVCTCRAGWFGDGLVCFPNATCGNCHDNAKCVKTGSDEHECQCANGYQGNGTDCEWINRCLENNGGCFSKGDCVMSGPGQVNCSCPLSYAGDGYTCFAGIVEEIQQHPNLTITANILKGLGEADFLLNMNSNYTVFVPVDEAMEQYNETGNLKYYMRYKDRSAQLVGYHTLEGLYTENDLLSAALANDKIVPMEGLMPYNLTVQQDVVAINGAKIVEADLPAIGGIIHIIDRVLDPPHIATLPSLEELVERDPDTIGRFYQALQSTGLKDVIYDLSNCTLFIPNNEALAGKPSLSRAEVSYYIIPYEVTSLQPGLKMYSLSNTTTILPYIWVSDGAKGLAINDGAMVIHSDVRFDNGMMYIVDAILTPGHCDRKHNGSVEPDCCDGYYGRNCDACPGSALFPCSNNGECDQGLNGTGSCECTGSHYGPLCDCNNGTCKTDVCLINNGGCSTHAECNLDARGYPLCTCNPGYFGDGVTCTSFCERGNGGCDQNARCFLNQQGSVECACRRGYHGSGYHCEDSSAEGPCYANNGGCSPRAWCRVISEFSDGPTALCICQDGFVGPGKYCNADLLDTVANTSVLTDFYQSVLETPSSSAGNLNSSLVSYLADESQTVTLFAPINSNTSVVAHPLDYVIPDADIYLYGRLTNGSVYLSASGRDVNVAYSVDQASGEILYTVCGVPIIKTNIPVTNGILHLIAYPFPPLPKPQAVVGAESQGVGTAGLVAGAVILIGLAAVAIAGVVVFKLKRSAGKSLVWRSGSGFTFRQLEQEQEDMEQLDPAIFEPESSFIEPVSRRDAQRNAFADDASFLLPESRD